MWHPCTSLGMLITDIPKTRLLGCKLLLTRRTELCSHTKLGGQSQDVDGSSDCPMTVISTVDIPTDELLLTSGGQTLAVNIFVVKLLSFCMDTGHNLALANHLEIRYGHRFCRNPLITSTS